MKIVFPSRSFSGGPRCVVLFAVVVLVVCSYYTYIGGEAKAGRIRQVDPATFRNCEQSLPSLHDHACLHEGVSSHRLLEQILAEEAHPHEMLLNSTFKIATQGTLMQIGANVGAVGNDPLHVLLRKPHLNSWKKIFIEPIPPLYERLVENYKDVVNCSFINAGIQSMSKTRTNQGLPNQPTVMYCYDWEKLPAKIPKWFSQICSMRKDRLQHPYDVGKIDKLPENITEYIVEYTITEKTVPSIVQESHVDAINALVIDTEGMDDIIVSDFMTETDLRPWIIIYEDVLLSSDRKRNIEAILKTKGYSVFPGKGQDTIAVLFKDKI